MKTVRTWCIRILMILFTVIFLYPNLTGTENLRIFAELRGLNKSKCVRDALGYRVCGVTVNSIIICISDVCIFRTVPFHKHLKSIARTASSRFRQRCLVFLESR